MFEALNDMGRFFEAHMGEELIKKDLPKKTAGALNAAYQNAEVNLRRPLRRRGMAQFGGLYAAH